MIGFVMFLHLIVCILLIIVILMQAGRGGGLNESFVAAESMFGAKTNEFMVKATMVLGSLFIISCLGLAFLSMNKEQSLMSKKMSVPMPRQSQSPLQAPGTPKGTKESEQTIPSPTDAPVNQIPAPVESNPVPQADSLTPETAVPAQSK